MATKERNRTLDYRPPPFSDDFGERLERLKELSGLSWGEFAELLGETQRGLLKWRRGGRPSGAYFWAIMELAREVPGGFELMLYGGAGWDGGTAGWRSRGAEPGVCTRPALRSSSSPYHSLGARLDVLRLRALSRIPKARSMPRRSTRGDGSSCLMRAWAMKS